MEKTTKTVNGKDLAGNDIHVSISKKDGNILLFTSGKCNNVFTTTQAKELIKCIEECISEKEQEEFNQEKCDWRYNASCVADANCSDECNMKCPYKKSE